MPDGDSPPGEGWELVPAMTPDELKGIHADFLSELPPSHRDDFRKCLDQPAYWKQWQYLMSDVEWSTQQAWRVSRQKSIGAAFVKRIKTIIPNISEESAESLLDQLRQIPQSKPDPTDASPRPDLTPVDLRSEQYRTDQLRDLLVRAIPLLPEEELKQIRIPAGLALDLLRNITQ
jgi:hypothetical protein